MPCPVTDSAATIAPPEAAGEEDLADLLLEVLPGDGGSLGNLAAREALAKAAGVEVGEEAYEAVKERLLAMGLIRKGRGRGGAIALAMGMEGARGSQAVAAAPRKARSGSGAAAETSFHVGQKLTLPQLKGFL
jgi:type I restriction enzyme M protein